MKRCFVLALIYMLLIVSARADYSSLTVEERRIVETALEQARYYRYFQTLVEGTDRIELVSAQKIGEVEIDRTTRVITVEARVRLWVADKSFIRDMKMPVTVRVSPGQSSPWPWVLAGSGWLAFLAHALLHK